jgi:hypothetical protein
MKSTNALHDKVKEIPSVSFSNSSISHWQLWWWMMTLFSVMVISESILIFFNSENSFIDNILCDLVMVCVCLPNLPTMNIINGRFALTDYPICIIIIE